MLTILQGDCLQKLRELPAESVHCCVTSPPYWGLRDYGVPPTSWPAFEIFPLPGLPAIDISPEVCCLGLEKNPWSFIGHMVLVFREIHRVLRSDGTCWVNMGDCYAGGGNGGGGNGGGGSFAKDGIRAAKPGTDKNVPARSGSRGTGMGIKSKDLIGQPWRLAFALQADGWYHRRDIIWHKPSPMPESVSDRPTTAHEYLFLFTKSECYFYDAEAIKEPTSGGAHSRGTGLNKKAIAGWADSGTKRAIDHAKPGGSFKGSVPGRSGGPGQERRSKKPRQNPSFSAAVNGLVETRNKRSVWTVPSQPYSEAHFATYPPDLIKPCILAGTSAGGVCPACGSPWERIEDEQLRKETGLDWSPACLCGSINSHPPVPATVLDPFGGSGTTGQVALELGRSAILVELNPKYIPLIERRTSTTMGLRL